MSAAPTFFGTPNIGSGLAPATADTSLTAPANVTTVLTAGANGTKVEELVIQGVGTTVVGLVNVFRYDGATYHLIDQFLTTAITVSTTVAAFQRRRTYDNLVLQTGDTLRFSVSIAGLQSLVKVTAFAFNA